MKAADRLTAKTALSAAKDAAERALEDAMASDEELAERKARQAALDKRKRRKLIALGIVGALLVLGVIGMVVSYWQWFLLAGLVGLLGLYGRYRWRKRREAKLESVAASAVEPEREAPKARAGKRVEPVPSRDGDVPSVEEERAEAERAIEDELAQLKARLDK